MGSSRDASLRHRLLDPDYWGPRLQDLRERPRHLVLFPRPELARPGIEVLELRMQAHDGARLRAILARSAFAADGAAVQLRSCADVKSAALDWRTVEEGGSDLVFAYPPERRLEDRVLDVVRIIEAACSLESIDCSRVSFRPTSSVPADEFAIAEWIRGRGWI